MALKPKDIRAMNAQDRAKALLENRSELMHERGLSAMGGAVKNPGRIRDLRTSIARLLTVERELQPGNGHGRAPAAKPAQAPKAAPAKAGKPAPKAAKAPAKAAKTAKGAGGAAKKGPAKAAKAGGKGSATAAKGGPR